MTVGAEGVDWDGRQGHPLRAWLQLAVPMALRDLARQGGPSEADTRGLSILASDIAAHGDTLLFGGRKGEAAALAARLARGLAILAYTPGGVTFAGIHWEATRPEASEGAADNG